jgi:hypothetical protein
MAPLSHETQVVRECLFVCHRQQIRGGRGGEPVTEGGLETLWRQAGSYKIEVELKAEVKHVLATLLLCS